MPDAPAGHGGRAFTVRYESLSRVLRTQGVGIGNAQAPPADVRPYSAIWDTGATCTSITTKVVEECGLTPISVTEVAGVHGTQLSNVYLIDVYLPNHVIAKEVQAVECPSLAGGLDDALIGMDIIGLGEFAVSNFQDKTTFTFRVPSMEEIDFALAPPRAHPKVGRNDQCPCGSGKKYKKCHGS